MIAGSELYQTYVRSTTLAFEGDVLVPADPKRVGLVFWQNGGSVLLLVLPQGAGSVGLGIQIPATGTLEFWWSRHAALVQSAWVCSFGLPPYTMLWAETLYVG